MIANKPFFVLLVCIWLLPFASVQLLPFGIPLYPIEAVLLVASPFLLERRIRNIFQTRITRNIFIFALILCGGIIISFLSNPETLIGLGQIKSFFFFPILLWLVATPILSEFECRKRVFWHLRWMFLATAVCAATSVFFGGLTYDYRLSAWFQSPNLLALFLLPGVILWWAYMLLKERIFVYEGIFWAIMTGVFVATQSYGAFVAAFAAILSFLWISRAYVLWKRPVFKIMLIGLLLIGTGIFLGGGGAGITKWTLLITGDERSSLSSREMIWRSAWKMIQDSPVFGIGPGRFQEVYLEYQRFYPPYLEWAVPHPHNLFLSFWLSSGIFGVFSIVWLCLFLFYSMRQISCKTEKALIGALFLGVFVAGLWDVPYFRAEFCFVFWLTLALFSGMVLRKK